VRPLEVPRSAGTYFRRKGRSVGKFPPMIEIFSSMTHHIRAGVVASDNMCQLEFQ